MARLSICKCCGKELQPNEKHMHSSKAYCAECYQKIQRESDEYKQLVQYICDNYKIERPTGLMLKQIKEYRNDYSYTYGGMTYTLWYVKDILSKEFITMYGVSLIKYYYEDASSYYIHQEEIKKSMEINSKTELLTKTVKKINRTNKSTQNSTLIDLGNLIKGGESY